MSLWGLMKKGKVLNAPEYGEDIQKLKSCDVKQFNKQKEADSLMQQSLLEAISACHWRDVKTGWFESKIQVSGRIAYVSQTAWIQNGTVLDNILSGSKMDCQRYQDTLERCSLLNDLESFPCGDLTEVGERGVNLTDAEKQRIQLARALYQDADVYLLDDPFDAMDAETAKSLFSEYVMGALAKKTVLLVTHQVDFLPAFNTVLVHGKMGYVPQTALLQTGTIVDNILFGSAMDCQRYQDTLERCLLLNDLESLPCGDLTEIGEGGVNLIEGQKQRIRLARALYRDADIYLLDDPFSAMDAETAKSLFNEYVMGALAGKTVFLVTRQVDFLPAFDSVLMEKSYMKLLIIS
ncbi:hypothetical protein Tsubulata_032678, partial [Turnera subulata]